MVTYWRFSSSNGERERDPKYTNQRQPEEEEEQLQQQKRYDL